MNDQKKLQTQTDTETDDSRLYRSSSLPQERTIFKKKEKEPSLGNQIWTAFTDGVYGGLTFMILIVYIFSNTLMAGHLHNSELYVEAFGIAGVYGNIFSFFVWGFNSGFVVTASRCFGLKDYKGMHTFFIKQSIFVYGILTIFYLYSVVIYFLVPILYPGDEMLIFWTRAYLVLVLPVNFSAFYMDTFRELYIANEFFKPALGVESVSMILSFFICYLFAFVLNQGFYGLVAGMIITQATCVSLYYGIWKKSKIFNTYWSNKDRDPNPELESPILERAATMPEHAFHITETPQHIVEIIAKTSIKTHSKKTQSKEGHNKSKTHEDVEEEEEEEHHEHHEHREVDLHSNWGYFKFNIVFSLTMFLDGFWWQMDAVLCSFLFDGASIAAQTTLTQFLNVITLFGYGYTMTLSSKISQYLVLMKIAKAKRITWIISIEMLIIGCVIAFPFVFMSDVISPIMINAVDTRIVLEKIMKIFGVSIPFMFLSSVSFSANRSINNQNKYFICQLLSNYGVHFGSFIFFRYWMKMGVESLWYAYLASQVSIVVVGFGMMMLTDWKKEAKVICKQMEKTGGNVGGH